MREIVSRIILISDLLEFNALAERDCAHLCLEVSTSFVKGFTQAHEWPRRHNFNHHRAYAGCAL